MRMITGSKSVRTDPKTGLTKTAGLFGDRSEGAHPWTRFTLSLV